jgi:hypothetical protein
MGLVLGGCGGKDDLLIKLQADPPESTINDGLFIYKVDKSERDKKCMRETDTTT